MQPSYRRVPGVDGLSLNLVDWGGEGTPLLLLHGYGHGAHLWDTFIPELIPQYHVLALDSRGHGRSDHDPEFRYHNAAVARDLEAVAEHLELKAAVVVGHSQGGLAAIRLAGRHPECVQRLVLAETAPDGSARGGTRETLRLLQPTYATEAEYGKILREVYPGLRSEAVQSLTHHFLKALDEGGFSPRLDPRFLRGSSKKSAERRGGFDREAWARKEEGRFWHYLAKVACPTLVIRGELSPMLPEAALDRMCDAIVADSQARTLTGAGHALMLDNPSEFRDALTHYLLGHAPES
ncbi:alpha/beta hydrolase [Myxococcota bacterium]|nr:alpha/beta hydrolase [Myxococcota bacterium]